MIAWLNPVALVTLVTVMAPILVHLLLRHRARRVVAPTVRFVPRLAPQAVRLRRQSDLWLLFVRAGIVCCAALALAGPLFVTDARRRAWSERIARAVIVDTGVATGAAELSDAIRSELSSSDPSRQEQTRELPPALRRAVHWLRQSPPARREIVVFSPFVRGALDEADVAAVPPEIGLRFVRTHNRSAPEPLRGRVVDAEGIRSFEALVEPDAIALQYAPAAPSAFQGLVIRARSDEAAAVERLRRVLARVGVNDVDAVRPVVVRFHGGAPHEGAAAGHPEATAAALRLVQDPAMARLPVTVTVSANELRVDADVEASSFEAATIVRSALDARVDPKFVDTHEVASIPDVTLRVWSRNPSDPSGENWDREDRSDARWFWLAALVLLAVEGVMRGRPQRRVAEVTADAA